MGPWTLFINLARQRGEPQGKQSLLRDRTEKNWYSKASFNRKRDIDKIPSLRYEGVETHIVVRGSNVFSVT